MGSLASLPINSGSNLSTLLGLTESSGLLGTVLSDVSGAIPFVGPIAQLITSFIHIGGGCGKTCIASAKGEQVFEVTGDDILHTVKLGMLDAQDGLAILGTILSKGQAFMSKLIEEGDSKAQDGLTNMTNVLNDLASTMQSYDKASKKLDITTAQQSFISVSNQGWYTESVVAGNNLATQILQTYLNSGLAASENTDLSSVLNSVLNGLTNELQAAQNSASNTMSGILGGISGLLGLASASSTSTGNKILGGILGSIGLSTNTANSIANDITGALADIGKVIKTFNTDIVGKLIDPILKSINDAQTLQGALEADLKNGLTGILQIPKQLAGYLTSQTNIAHQNTLLSNDNRTSVASDILTPGIGGAISEQAKILHEKISDLFSTPETAVEEFSPIPLSEYKAAEQAFKDIKSFKDAIAKPDKWYLTVAKYLIYGLEYLETMTATLAPGIRLAEQAANEAIPTQLLPVSTVVDLLHRDLISWPQAITEVNKQGLDGTRLFSLYTLADQLLGTREAIEAYYRGIITQDALDKEFDYLNYDAGRQQVLTELAKYLPDVGTAANWFARGFITPEQFRETLQFNRWSSDEIAIAEKALFTPANSSEYTRFWARKEMGNKGFLANAYTSEVPTDVQEVSRTNQKSIEQAKLDWLAHWKDLDLFTWLNGLYRGLIDDSYFTEAIKSLNYPGEVSSFITEVNRPLIPFFYLTEMLAAGIFTESEATAYLKQYGFSDESIKASIKFGNFKALGKATDQNNALAQLSVSNLKAMYDDKIINKSQLVIALQEHGYNSEVAILLADLYETQDQIKANNAYATMQVNLVKIGAQDKLQALDNLQARGYTPDQIVKYELEIDNIKVSSAKLPSKADFDAFFKKSLITEKEYIQALELLGYSNQWATLFLEELVS